MRTIHFFSATFVALASIKASFVSAIYIYNFDTNFLFWSDLIGRGLYYLSAVFAVQITLYKFYPNSKKRFLVSFFVALVGIGLITYQLINRNQPTIDANNIINFNPDLVMIAGIGSLVIIPWTMTSVVFIREYIKNNFKPPKPLLIGLGFLIISIGGIFQDVYSDTRLFILFSILLAFGFLFAIVGLFYDD